MQREDITDRALPPRRWAAIVTAWLLIATGVLSAAALVTGADALGASLPGGLPLGNGLAVLTLCAWPVAAWLVMRRGSAGRRFAGLSVLLSMAWLPVSVALAGNLQLDFAGPAGTAWLVYTAIAAVAAMLTLPWAALQGVSRAWRRHRSA